MRLKSLSLHGFKSFADRTEFEFHPGVTAIVGPNGCGKSNVVDAVRWVLGETSAKALRGGEMADVIFNGTDKRKPVGLAEVTLTFADCEEALKVDFNEVSFTRRVFRDGKSEYRINNRLCRLKDIQNLLMDTGIGRTAYSIMEQGKIDLLLSSKPEDRRTVFEEAAGITKFKVQKKEALRKLDYTESNLVRVADIMTELQRQRDSLQRQANKARRYRELLDDLTTLDTHLAHRQYRELNAENEELTHSIAALQRQEDACREEIEQRSRDLSARREHLEKMEALFHELSQQQMTLRSRIQSGEGRIGFNEERAGELHRFIAQNEAAIEETERKCHAQKSALERAENHLVQLKGQLDTKRQDLSAARETLAAVQARRGEVQRAVAAIQGKRQTLYSETANLEALFASRSDQRESDVQRLARVDEEMNHLVIEEQQYVSEIEYLAKAIDEEAAALAACQLEREKLDQEVRELELEQRECNHRLRKSERAIGETQSRLDVLQRWVEQGEGFEKGTQNVIKGLDDAETYKNSVRGVLGSMIEIKADDYLPQVEAALREHLQTVLIANGTVAESMMNRLHEKQLGYASVLPEDTPLTGDVNRPDVDESGVTPVLDVLVCHPKIRPRIERLLGHLFLCGTLSRARELQQKYPGCGFISARGEFVTPEGIIFGGSAGQTTDSILQKQTEIRKLQKRLARQESEHLELSTRLDETEKQFAHLHAAREELRERTQTHQLNRSRMEDQKRLATLESQRVQGRLKNLRDEAAELNRRHESSLVELDRIDQERHAKRDALESLNLEADQRESELESLSDEEAAASSHVSRLLTELAVEEQAEQALREQRTPMAGRLQELDELRHRHEQEIANHRRRLEELEHESEELKQTVAQSQVEVGEVERKLQESFESRKSIQQEVRGFEDVLARKNQERSALQEQRGREEVRTTQLGLRLENIANIIFERYQVDIGNFRPDSHQLLLALESQRARNRRARTNRIEESGESSAPDAADGEETSLHEADEPEWPFIEASVSDMRRKLDSMGPVNLDAIQEFEETEERLLFLQEQHDDAIRSREELLEVLAKINTESRKQFAETFVQVRQNFKQMFQELFGEASKADLVLIDEDDPLESGIDIIAKPPGKKLQTISLLSGGERSLTAVALLFAIYMVKPSPFCVLDELDAPLDEANIARFVRILDRFIDQCQFVIITHSKRTMNRADVMYGVTMEEFGVSKPVGMKLTEDAGELEDAVIQV